MKNCSSSLFKRIYSINSHYIDNNTNWYTYSYGRSCGSVTSAHQSSASANSHMGGYGSGLSSTGSQGTGKAYDIL